MTSPFTTYWNYRDEISHHDGLLSKGERVIIPNAMYTSMLQVVHGSHLGIEKWKRRAKDVLYWPGMTTQIEDVVQNCAVCARYTRGVIQRNPYCVIALASLSFLGESWGRPV